MRRVIDHLDGLYRDVDPVDWPVLPLADREILEEIEHGHVVVVWARTDRETPAWLGSFKPHSPMAKRMVTLERLIALWRGGLIRKSTEYRSWPTKLREYGSDETLHGVVAPARLTSLGSRVLAGNL